MNDHWSGCRAFKSQSWNRQSRCLKPPLVCQCPVWAQVLVLADPLLIQFLPDAHGKAKVGPHAWASAPKWDTQGQLWAPDFLWV